MINDHDDGLTKHLECFDQELGLLSFLNMVVHLKSKEQVQCATVANACFLI